LASGRTIRRKQYIDDKKGKTVKITKGKDQPKTKKGKKQKYG
jgi:hypothetical protein